MGRYVILHDMSLIKPATAIEADVQANPGGHGGGDLFGGFADSKLLTPGEVAVAMRVDPKTVTRWAAAGKLPSIRTPGGHRRYRVGDLRKMVEATEGT